MLGIAIIVSSSKQSTAYAVNILRTEDPGHTENNPVFIYLEAFATDDHFKRFYPEFPNLAALEAAYRKGGIGDVRVKQFLAAVLYDLYPAE